MSFAFVIGLGALIFSTSFLSGIFGMAGGLILMGALLPFLPVPAAMVLHAVTQIAANGWRGLMWRRYADGWIVLRFGSGALAAFAVFAFVQLVPDRATVLIALGLVPFIAMAVPEGLAPRADRRGGAEICGFACTGLMLLSGVSGPALDVFFVRTAMDRRAVVATKACCQVLSHLAKLVYFGGIAASGEIGLGVTILVVAVVLAVLGTTTSRPVLERLSDVQFRRWTQWAVLAIGIVYLVQGVSSYVG
ncbi:TSUP family transporter [Marinivivus vitaminiproducens]|uniref:TSUP family transporter n=1 Tax=Marinivivus vitaminiproducens TaxID=3035935 RepID=UPI0027A68B53|nr:TSUP family transporter [Geminicoccaceae bacterium SCSIO 64248]